MGEISALDRRALLCEARANSHCCFILRSKSSGRWLGPEGFVPDSRSYFLFLTYHDAYRAADEQERVRGCELQVFRLWLSSQEC